MYTYRNESYGTYRNPTTERISKVFPGEDREFDNVIWLWHDYCAWYVSEERLAECIEQWLSWKDARELYDKEIEDITKKTE